MPATFYPVLHHPQKFLLVDEPNMRGFSAFYILLASGRLFFIPFFAVVHALPCDQNALSLPSSSSPYPPSCRTTLNSGSESAPNNTTSLTKLFLNTPAQLEHIDSTQNFTYLTSTLVLTIILFVIFAALLIVLLFFGPNILSFLRQKTKKEEKPKLGFGFDGLSKQELRGLRLKEEEAAAKTSWFTKLPIRPPALTLKHTLSPLLPIQIPRETSSQSEDSQSVESIEFDDEKEDETDRSHSQEYASDDGYSESLCKDEIRHV